MASRCWQCWRLVEGRWCTGCWSVARTHHTWTSKVGVFTFSCRAGRRIEKRAPLRGPLVTLHVDAVDGLLPAGRCGSWGSGSTTFNELMIRVVPTGGIIILCQEVVSLVTPYLFDQGNRILVFGLALQAELKNSTASNRKARCGKVTSELFSSSQARACAGCLQCPLRVQTRCIVSDRGEVSRSSAFSSPDCRISNKPSIIASLVNAKDDAVFEVCHALVPETLLWFRSLVEKKKRSIDLFVRIA